MRLKKIIQKKHANLSYIVQLAYSAIIVERVLSIFTRMFLHRIFKFIQSRLKTHIALCKNIKKKTNFQVRGAYTFFIADTYVILIKCVIVHTEIEIFSLKLNFD